MNRESSIQAIVGKESPELTKQIAKDELDKQFQTQERMRSREEKEKTPVEIEIIHFVNHATNTVLADYGIDPFDVPLKNVHIIKEQDWEKTNQSGVYLDLHQSIEIKERPEKIVIAAILFHEMLHFKSYSSVELANGKFESLRTGLATHTRPERERIFVWLNEAVVSELQKRFVATLSDNPLFQDEVERTKVTVAKSPTLQAMPGLFYAQKIADSKTYTTADSEFYAEQRGIFTVLMEKIQEKSPEDFADTEEVFTLFVQGLFSPTLLRVGKLIERSFGAGTFRKIANLGNNLYNLREYIEQL